MTRTIAVRNGLIDSSAMMYVPANNTSIARWLAPIERYLREVRSVSPEFGNSNTAFRGGAHPFTRAPVTTLAMQMLTNRINSPISWRDGSPAVLLPQQPPV